MIISIFGPTGVGKSRVAVAVAACLGGEIVSADSMQVYRGLPILTDQPSHELMQTVPHHLVGYLPLDEEYSAAQFVQDAVRAVAAIEVRGKMPLLAGGTGLYLRALLGDFSFAGEGEASARLDWQRFIAEEGDDAAWQELLQLDPQAAETVDRHNRRRLARALEAAESGGASISAERDRLWSAESAFDVLSYGLEMERQELYSRIDDRVDAMLVEGAIDEVRRARRGTVSRTAGQAIGFVELSDFLDGKLSLAEAAEMMKKKSRRYAKRQLTWMRKMPDIVRIDLTGSGIEAAAGDIIERIQSHEKNRDK